MNYFFFSPSSLCEAFLGVGPKAAAKLLPRWILPSQTGQHWPSGWMVREQDRTGQMTGSQITVRFYVRGKKGREGSCRFKHLVPLAFCRSYLAAAGETPVVVGRPAGAVSVMLVLEEAGVGVLLQLLGVLRHQLLHFRLLHVNPGPRLAVVGHVDLGVGEGEVEREGEAGKDRKERRLFY